MSTIRGNRFIHCGEPVVRIWPEVQTARVDEPVHGNIRIEGNFFQGAASRPSSVQGLSITGNRFSGEVLVAHRHART